MLPKDKLVLSVGRVCTYTLRKIQTRNLSSNFVPIIGQKQDKQLFPMTCFLPTSVMKRRALFSCDQVRMKGHAHWQNVASVKKEMAAKTSATNTALRTKLVHVIREGGSADPKFNRELEKVLKECSAANVPKVTVQSWLNQIEATQKKGKTYLEVQGPRGVVFVLKMANSNHTVLEDVNRLAKKLKTKLLKHSNWMKVFEEKGEIVVAVTPDMDVTNMDKYIEIAIEAGAEDVIVTENDINAPEVDKLLKFHCEPLRLDSVAKEIQETFDLEVYSKDADLIPHTFATLTSEEDVKHCQIVIQKMLEMDSVEKVFDNIAPPED